MTQKHRQVSSTRRPWVIVRRSGYQGLDIASLQDDVYFHVVSVDGSTGDEVEANAHFIVQACNAHDELLAALKECMSLVGEDNLPENVNDVLDRALAAIAKATSPQAP